MKRGCPYCAQINTKKDGFGYCKVYDCFGRSGMRQVLENLSREALHIFISPDEYMNVGSTVTNSYRLRNRLSNQVMDKAKSTFGFVPNEVLKYISERDREPWDKNIRW